MNANQTALATAALLIGLGASAQVPAVVTTQPPSHVPRIVAALNDHDHEPQLIGWLAAQEWPWGVGVLPYAAADSVRSLSERGWQIVLEMHGHPDARARKAARSRRPVVGLEETLDRFREAAPGKLAWQILFEDDSSGIGVAQEFLRENPRTHQAANHLLDGYLEEAVKHRQAAPKVPLWGVCGYAGNAHAFASRGLGAILVERVNDDVEDLQTAVAFARGASRQYGCDWGLDLSLWWGAINGCVQNLPASVYQRHLYLAYFSGARVFRLEGVDLLVARDGAESPIVTEVAEFFRTVRGVDPGSPEVPVAVIMPPDAGWMSPPYWRTGNEAWNFARVPYRPGERGVDGFFGIAFPGSVYAMDPFPFGSYTSDEPPASPFSLACVTPEFAPESGDEYRALPPIPFGRFVDRVQAGRFFESHRADPSPYRPMADSRWGDLFDVLTPDAGDEVLARYKVLVLLGPLLVEPALRGRLLRHVEQGGVLVGASGVWGPDDHEVTGVRFATELRVGRAWQWQEDAWTHEAYRYVPVDAEIEDASVSVLARTQTGEPLIVGHHKGKGTVYTCLAPWFEAGHRNLLGTAARLFDEVLSKVQPVVVSGPPCEWLTTTAGPDRFLIIANHDSVAWQGAATWNPALPPGTTCVELTTGGSSELISGSTRTELRADIPPYAARVFRLGRSPAR